MTGSAGSARDMSSGSLVMTACPRSRAHNATWTSITSLWPLRAHSRPTVRATFGVMMDISWASHETSNLCRALGLLSVGADWRDRSYGFTGVGKSTALGAQLRRRA